MEEARFRELVGLYNKLLHSTAFNFISGYLQKGAIAYAARQEKRIPEMHSLTDECKSALYKQAKIYVCIGDLIPDFENIPQEYIGCTEQKLDIIVKECIEPGSKRGKEKLFDQGVRRAWLVDAAKLSVDDLKKKIKTIKGQTVCECQEWEEKTEVVKVCKSCGKKRKKETDGGA